MKLPDFANYRALLELREQMGAVEPGNFQTGYRPDVLTIAEIEQLARGGIDVSIEDIHALKDGTLAYKDSRVLVYIRDVSTYGLSFTTPRFHVAFCRTLREMWANSRSGRYVVATREDGLFAINKIRPPRPPVSEHMRLNVCQNCLDALTFDGFRFGLPGSRRAQIVQGFAISRFFEQYPKSLFVRRPEHTNEDAPLNDYPADFAEVSLATKASRNWTCEECDLNLSAHNARKFLHVHHLNGQKYDSRPSNLKVLCWGCHASEPLHAHMKSHPDYSIFIQRFGWRGR